MAAPQTAPKLGTGAGLGKPGGHRALALPDAPRGPIIGRVAPAPRPSPGVARFGDPVKRHPAYDAPEYQQWQPDAAVQAEFAAALEANPARKARLDALDDDAHLRLYAGLVAARLHDIQLKRWVMQGVISKAWLGSGEEAVTVGCCAALAAEDVCSPMIRNAAALIERGVPLDQCFAAYLGTEHTQTRGRDLHVGDLERGVIAPISHVADMVPVLAGCALAFKLRGEARVALTWTGDGSTATGAFHEGLRCAASLQVPLVLVVQDNQVALGTDGGVHFRGDFAQLGPAYGVPVLTCDGNHVLDVFAATAEAVDRCRRGEGPVVLVARTFRMGGHATHDEREARALFSPEVFAAWGQRDPIGCYETWLTTARGISTERLAAVEAEQTARIEAAAREALARRETGAPDPAQATHGVFAEPAAAPTPAQNAP